MAIYYIGFVNNFLQGQMHTIYDTIETVSFVQIGEFVKIGLGWLVELAEPASVRGN